MDPRFITPFITSIQNVFSMMLQMPVNVGEPRIKEGSTATYDVSGIIAMSGDVTGNIVLSFPADTAERLVTLFVGMEIAVDNPDFADAIGELVNMVSGNAKASFEGMAVSISCPSVIIGEHHAVSTSSDTPCVVVPCDTDCGELAIEIAIRETTAGGAADGSTTQAA
ncbi:MAG: chemotaxis protein CheX [Planctomycetota bacterium]